MLIPKAEKFKPYSVQNEFETIYYHDTIETQYIDRVNKPVYESEYKLPSNSSVKIAKLVKNSQILDDYGLSFKAEDLGSRIIIQLNGKVSNIDYVGNMPEKIDRLSLLKIVYGLLLINKKMYFFNTEKEKLANDKKALLASFLYNGLNDDEQLKKVLSEKEYKTVSSLAQKKLNQKESFLSF